MTRRLTEAGVVSSRLANGFVSGIESIDDVAANPIAIDQEGEITEADWRALDESDAIMYAQK